MEKMVERYVYDVARRLPEESREEVSKELEANIYDMLSDHPEEDEIRDVLYQMGSPAALADKYRQKPRYLISPAMYEAYVSALKWVLPLVGSVVLVIGAILGVFEAMRNGIMDVGSFFGHILSRSFSLGISAAFQALVWTTAGFVMAERISAHTVSEKGIGKTAGWKIEDLPEVLPNDKKKIPLSDSIVGLVMTGVFSVAAILVCLGIVPLAFYLKDGDLHVSRLFSDSFLTACIPGILVMGILGIIENIVKIRFRRWTPLTCSVVVATSLAFTGILLYLLNRSDLFSSEFVAFVQNKEWGTFDLLRYVEPGLSNPVILSLSIVIALATLAGCGVTIYKTYKKP
ncbi:MAG: hypothetical protein JW724_07235 [Candidatus Altiarchaeota archaeon]|nr:hypothetical protein [Candidatus Altiarchaeota archaeon]